MHNPAPVLVNNTHKLLRDFDLQMDHLISARRPDLMIINKKKKTSKIVDLAVSADHRIKLKECEKKNKYFDLARELKKLWNMQVTIIPIAENGQNTEKSPGDLRRLAVTQTPVKDHQQTLM